MSLAEGSITLDATGFADLARQRLVGPAKLVESSIRRFEQVEPKLTGVAAWTLDQPRLAARMPLKDAPSTGVPVLFMDDVHVAGGIHYHNGSRIWSGWAPPQDSDIFRRFKAADLIILGSTEVPELSSTPVTKSRHLCQVKTLGPWTSPPGDKWMAPQRPPSIQLRRSTQQSRSIEGRVGMERAKGYRTIA